MAGSVGNGSKLTGEKGVGKVKGRKTCKFERNAHYIILPDLIGSSRKSSRLMEKWFKTGRIFCNVLDIREAIKK